VVKTNQAKVVDGMGHVERLPKPAVNMVRRVSQLAAAGNGVYDLTLVVIDGLWYLRVGSGRLERLGAVVGE
jgi:nitrogen fixation protein FixH